MPPTIRRVAAWVVKLLQIPFVDASVVPLESGNVDSVLANNEIVFVNFYADWCRFSQQLKPIFEEASNKFNNLPTGKVTFASVDCDKQPAIAQKYHVNKYPTLKIFRNGELIKKEYRGQRSVDSLAEFVTKQTQSTVQSFASKEDLSQRIDNLRRNVIGYFPQMSGDEFANFQKASAALREDCIFWLGTGDWVRSVVPQRSAIYFRGENSPQGTADFEYSGPLANYDYMKQWLTDKCVPLVREITFENAEELTEEGLPFLILFRSVGDVISEKIFKDSVSNELHDLKTSINTLMADGKKFAHPLHHLGKSEKDLPLIAIDSFRHMYLFPSFDKLNDKGTLRQFVMDLHSGKLHREFHNGPDPTQPPQVPQNGGPQQAAVPGETQPPPSVFKKLKPSDNRYTVLKDEL